MGILDVLMDVVKQPALIVGLHQDGANLFDDFGPKVHNAFSFLRSCALKYDGNNDSDGAE